MMSWGSARSFCEEQGKRLPTKDEALKEWKSLEESGYIWTSAEKDSSKAFYLNLRLGALKEDWKSNEHSAVCVCPSAECKAPDTVKVTGSPVRKKLPEGSLLTDDLVWWFEGGKGIVSWDSANLDCRGQDKRLPTKEEALKHWSKFPANYQIWTSDEIEKNSRDAFYIDLTDGRIGSMYKSNLWNTAVCVCPASECSPAVLKKKEELYWEPVKFVTAAGGLKMREGPSVKSRSFCTVPEGTVLKISERADQKETIDGTEGVWMKAGSCGKSGWFFGGYLCSITEEGCNDYHDFINTFKTVCPKGCSSVKEFDQGDEGKMWKESSHFSINDSKKEFYLGVKYNALGGRIISVKKIRNVYYMLYHDSGNADPIDSLRHIRVKTDPSGRKLFTHHPEKDYNLKLNDFSNQLIEYR